MEWENASTTARPSPFCVDSYLSKVFTIMLYSVLMLLSLAGNLLVVAVFHKNRTLRTPVNYLILNMAISDLLIPTFALPWLISITYLDNAWLVNGVLGEILCKVVCMAPSLSLVVSTVSMIVIAVDRFHAIFFAMKPPLISVKACRRIIGATWLIAVIFRAHFLYAYRLVRTDENKLKCAFQWRPQTYELEAHKITWITMFSLNVVSAVVLTALYSSIVVLLHRQEKNIIMQSEIVRKRAQENRKVTFMLMTVMILFFVVWSPYHVYTFLYFLKPTYVRKSCTFLWIAYNFPLLYTVTNPFVYYSFNNKYRQGFREILFWPCKICKTGCCMSVISKQDEQKGKSSRHCYSQSLRLRPSELINENAGMQIAT